MRSRLLLPALLVCLGAAAAGCDGGTARGARPPNVVVYLVDTLRRDHLSVYGYTRPTSPRLEAFARDAVRFETAYSTTSWTRPAVASLLTGVSPGRHKAISLSDRLDPAVPLLPQRLRAVGYHSAAFVTNPSVLPMWGFGRGFDAFVDLVADDGRPARADEITEAVLRHLDAHRAEPFFFYVHTVDPHSPYDAPPPFDASFPRPPLGELESPNPRVAARAKLAAVVADYDAEVRFSDHEFGRLMDSLEARGLYRDALVVFTSDHGEELRDHGQLGHGKSLYEEVVQVPLLVKLPANIHAGRVVDAPVSLLDVLPTIVGLAGGEADHVEGVDLRELVVAEEKRNERPRPFFLDLDLTSASDERAVGSAVVWGGYKLVDSQEPTRGVRLFDLVRDPGERRNAAAREPALTEHLRSVLAEQRARAEAGVHLWLANADDGRTRRVEGTLRTSGRFAAVRAFQIEQGDRVEVARDGSRLHLSLALKNRRNPFPHPPPRFVDQDRLVFTVEPPGATLEIESLSIDGSAAPIFLGADPDRARSAPLVVDPALPGLRVERMGALFLPAGGASAAVLGAQLGVVQPARATGGVALDPAVEQRLRALGYLD
jgi:arylsulfatase A-like enzyme